jgi:threonine dehydrogenase-like Zn-dependent dehydrogenase
MHELSVVGSYGSSLASWPRALQFLAEGRVQAEPMISDVLPITAWEEGFRKTAAQESIKVLLEPGA